MSLPSASIILVLTIIVLVLAIESEISVWAADRVRKK
jgi:hypothetical protein